MQVFKLTTNTGTQFVRSTDDRLRARMWDYIRECRQQGMPLEAIMFSWTPVRVGTV